ncbi:MULTISPECIES: HAMP domain-containing sensor histidine kinase [unclassified Actinomyces]|uniref:sensor histidine kinase n=1 Tax=Actinomyces sp. 565 TaxID=2057794 RepID=UPI0013A6A42E|nr:MULTISPECIES: HAMP domain-containing sensor histidine kinase [unclassified Actinomyces]MBW3069198.1 HAMP domain-containing histidine kinase [Actinomyces sp. 594]NDR53378.1 HAMP domain-containing histidine kinase [Actinomyces sp. 565]
MTACKRAWRTQPLRTRLALLTTGLLTVGLFASSLSVTSLLENHLVGQVDAQLRNTAQAIGTQGLTALSSSRINSSDASSSMPSTYYVEAQYLDGKTGQMVSSDTANKYGVPAIGILSVDDAVAQASDPRLFTVESNQLNHPWRVIILPIDDRTSGEHVGVVAIALPLSDVMETVEQTRLAVALTDVSLILLGAMAATYLVRRSFRTLRQIEGVAGQIASGDLSARVPVTEPPTTEVGSLQRALNTMLQQNEQAFDVQVVAQERMTRFVSDASHELRTPLSAIRGYGELYRMGGVPPERTAEVMGRIESEASRMGRLVDDLLQLARMDEGREMSMAPVDLTQIAAGALTDMMVLAPDRDCALIPLGDAAGADNEVEPAMVLGDRDRLSQVLTNLLGNVTRHTPEGTPVEIAVGTVPHPAGAGAPGAPSVVVEVRDHGPGVAPADAKKVFQRFYRADTSRNRKTGGSGLGLSIVAAIIARHRGTVRMDQTPGGGATVHIELPALVTPVDKATPTPDAQ